MSGEHVLIVDDEPLIRRALAEYLVENGYEATVASNGAEGLAWARADRFHIVLVDLRMPHVDGLEVIDVLRTEQPDLPVVVISGTGVLDDAIEAMRRGAWDYITKPIPDMGEVLVVLDRVLGRARLVAERDRYQRELEQLNRSLEAEVARQTYGLRMQNRELAALNRLSYAISDPLDLSTMLERATEAAMAAVEAEGGMVHLLDLAIGQLSIAAARGLFEPYAESARAISLGEGIIGGVAQSGDPRAVESFTDDPWLAPIGEAGVCLYLCVPLRAGEGTGRKHLVVGTLGVGMRAERDLDVHEINLLATIGNQIGVAVARAQYAADLQRTNVELEQANAELRRLDTLREQFIQNVAHELRTPLALVHGYVEMFVQGELQPEEQRMALDVMARRVQVLVDLVDAITTLQDLDRRPLRVEKLSLVELIETACQMASQRALTGGVELRYDHPPDPPPIHGDFTRLAQALYQLIDNACKFSPEGTVVTVAVEAPSTEGDVRISVTDQGIGIPTEEQVRIFERFYQVDGSLARRYGGTGLGLALAKEIVEAHGGKVTVESEVGVGSTFTICLLLPDQVGRGAGQSQKHGGMIQWDVNKGV